MKILLGRAGGALLLAGFAVFCMGAYYLAVKAGIPYHDAPQELRISYAVHQQTGRLLLKNGLALAALGGGMKALSYMTGRKRGGR